jgi:hypothetical protein
MMIKYKQNMKNFLMTALIMLSVAACSNGNNRSDGTNRMTTEETDDDKTLIKVTDDGNTLSMKVKSRDANNPVSYSQSFDVRDMNDEQKKSLKNHILDSLGIKD